MILYNVKYFFMVGLVTIFDLLFAALFLIALGSLVAAAIDALRGRRARALVVLRRTGVAAALYFGVIIVISALSPQRFVGLGDDQCSDDWCIAVQAVHRDTIGNAVRYDITFRLSSRARRVDQREQFVTAYLRDQQDRRYDALAESTAVPFDTLLGPGQTVPAVRQFNVPIGTRIVGLVIAREGGGRIPGCCIIGDQESLFHRHVIVKLE